MVISSTPEDGGGNVDLLLKTSETVLEMAGIARINEVNKETRVFYSHLGNHCLKLRDYSRRALQTSYRLNGEQVNQTLGHLDSLVPESGLRELPSCEYLDPVEFRLGALNLHWNEVRKQHDQAKLEFISRWLRPGASEERRGEVDRALDECVNDLEQPPEPSFKKSADKFESLGIGEPSYAVWKAAQSIFDALLDCKGCSCPSQHEFRAKLELSTYRKPEQKIDKKPLAKSNRNRPRKSCGDDDAAGELDFDMFLSMERDWHEVRVQIIKERGICFNLPGEVVSPRRSSAANRYTKIERLCRPITKTKTKALQRLLLKLTSGQLFEMGFEKSNFQIDKTTEPISLAQFFEERHELFTEKTKRILSLIIGHTVLHLNGTSWLQPGWGSANIKFFQTTSCKTPLRPFIQTQLPKDSPANETPDYGLIVNSGDGDDDMSDDLYLEHPCPAVVALAVVLMEIYFVKPFKKLAEMQHIPLIPNPSGRINFIDVVQVFNGDEEDEEMKEEGWRSQIPEDSPLLTAIDNCLDGELWEDEEGQALDSATLRSRIYQKVVRLLELHLTHGFSQIPLDSVDKYARNLDFGKWGQVITSQEPDGQAPALPPRLPTPTRTPSPALILFSPNQVGVHSIGPEFGKHMLHYSQAHSLRYLVWKSEYIKVYERFIEEYLPKHSLNPVKIAILDTGIDRDHLAIKARKENLQGKRNCYNEYQKNVPDGNGHGTFAASLILDYAPDAMLYVIKIVDKENAIPDAKIVVNAIDHAVQNWDVDIISMSFGWPSSDFDGYDALQAAIDRAYGKKVLMFAAAANSGGRLGRAYPASSSHVICVHSTNTYGSASDFSPTAEPNTINIATVGESIESAWPLLLCDKSNQKCVEVRSGTSYATPIVAGIAAFLLQYARLHLTESAARELKRKEKMEALMRRCAKRGPNYQPRDGYFYVELSLNGHNLFGEELEGVNREILKTLKT
ncbi:Major intracellular serine protease [Tolypocladium ophioglossoides CBS 100239]|uniref:Major intracellular serine protease n=1 Tax=Tolypocladium ophioglossoides (strain CBS 100239) TaxID=1163406 RepID=A0A0L0N8Y1_TOLOC|nr:Major intracellular serine protease [Tolypocladium ophioglossoides CBS 100239]